MSTEAGSARCQHGDCDRWAMRCTNPSAAGGREDEHFCGLHAPEHGYCCMCGESRGGIGSTGYCDNCWFNLMDDNWEDD